MRGTSGVHPCTRVSCCFSKSLKGFSSSMSADPEEGGATAPALGRMASGSQWEYLRLLPNLLLSDPSVPSSLLTRALVDARSSHRSSWLPAVKAASQGQPHQALGPVVTWGGESRGKPLSAFASSYMCFLKSLKVV